MLHYKQYMHLVGSYFVVLEVGTKANRVILNSIGAGKQPGYPSVILRVRQGLALCYI
jgi:hypothetical protein